MKRLTLSLAIAFAFSSAHATPYPDLPQPLADGGGALIGDTVYVGLGSAGAQFFALDLSQPDSGWQTLAAFPGGERSQPVVAASNGKLYVFGGLQKNSAGELQLVNDGYVYDPNNEQWHQLPTRSPLGLVGTSALSYGDKIYMIGGSNLSIFNGYFQDYTAAGEDKAQQQAVMTAYFDQPAADYFFNNVVFSYQPSSNRWHNEGAFPYAGRAGAAVSLYQQQMIVANGEIKPGLRSDAVASAQWDKQGTLHWHDLPNLIPSTQNGVQDGLAGAYSGDAGGHYVLAGGANFPGARAQYDAGQYYAHQGLSKATHTTVYTLHDNAQWQVIGDLPEAAAYGVSVPYGDALLLIGGKNNEQTFSSVRTLRYNGEQLNVE